MQRMPDAGLPLADAPGLYLPGSEAIAEGARIVLVDDEPRIREAVEALIAQPGRQILHCGTGAEALRILGGGQVDLALLDIRLPDMTGLEILERVRQQGSSVRVIIVSADDQVDSAIAALRFGAYEYVRKPFEPAALRTWTTLSQLRLGATTRMRGRLEQSGRLQLPHRPVPT
jgi:DNA-binding response OmpR family regulator